MTVGPFIRIVRYPYSTSFRMSTLLRIQLKWLLMGSIPEPTFHLITLETSMMRSSIWSKMKWKCPSIMWTLILLHKNFNFVHSAKVSIKGNQGNKSNKVLVKIRMIPNDSKWLEDPFFYENFFWQLAYKKCNFWCIKVVIRIKNDLWNWQITTMKLLLRTKTHAKSGSQL